MKTPQKYLENILSCQLSCPENIKIRQKDLFSSLNDLVSKTKIQELTLYIKIQTFINNSNNN